MYFCADFASSLCLGIAPICQKQLARIWVLAGAGPIACLESHPPGWGWGGGGGGGGGGCWG